MNDSFNFNASQAQTGQTDVKPEGICPVLIGQLNLAPEGNFQMWGMSFNMLTMVVIVRQIETTSTKITYTVEDSTGQIDAHFWLDEGSTLNSPNVMEGTYARLFGTVRSTGGKKTIMVFNLQPVSNPNDVNTHMLEVLNARYKAEDYYKKGSGGGSVGGSYNDFSLKQDNGEADSTHGMSGKQLAVFNAIKSHVSDEGISRQELESKFGHISKTELGTLVENMVNEGLIYTSIDADHFLSTS